MNIPVISIGNSKGIRIPQPILKQCNFGNEVSLEVRENEIVIRRGSRANPVYDFDHMGELDDMTVQLLLRECDYLTLALALVDAPVSVKEKIYMNMSERAKTMLAEHVTRLEGLDTRGLIVEMNRVVLNRILERVLP
ncbi:MAG: hypothetical protein EHM28_02825 [Spirochaetaceae bacterium]|nr:MAG: hypothetical protein EHM28_02825 [Spirochaetaceae bacterium]